MKEQVSQTKKGSVLRTSMYVAVLIGLAAFLIFSILAAITFGNADLSASSFLTDVNKILKELYTGEYTVEKTAEEIDQAWDREAQEE